MVSSLVFIRDCSIGTHCSHLTLLIFIIYVMNPYNVNNLPTQEAFFHNGKWNADMDAVFLSELVEQKNNNIWIPPHVPATSAIMSALYEVNTTFGRSLAFADGLERVQHLETRYLTFRTMLLEKGTYWDQEANKVAMSDRAWVEITGNNPLARAYYHKGEPEFYKLAILFGPTELKVEDTCSVIVISDTTIRINGPEYVNISDSDSEEVTSPVMKSDSKLRRKLIYDDAQSTTSANMTNAWPPNNAFPPPMANYFPDVKSEHDTGSSCASSSPWKWFK